MATRSPSASPPRISAQATAYAQIILSVLFTLGYFLVLWEFMHGRVNVPESLEGTFTALVTFLTANLGSIIYYWFQRMRTNGGMKGKEPS